MSRVQITFGAAPSSPERVRIAAPPAATWPFIHPLTLQLPSAPATVVVDDIHEAFVNHQRSGTRLVTTQGTYQLIAWTELIEGLDVVIEGTGDRAALERYAPELLAHAAARAFAPVTAAVGRIEEPGPSTSALMAAFRADDAEERLRLCVQALDHARTPAALIATASVCMEVNDFDAAARDLDEAIEQAPTWAAAHFERGKLWLRRDDMERARESFQKAASLMPRFASAWSNLGATLGELDRPEEALAAFQRALACDPASAQTHNNIGVVSRELGKLPESEAAFRRVLELAPDLAFGYYNLGHTLFLQGRYQAALAAYAEGQKRDPERNPVQASRLAMCRLATGDAAGAITELQRATSALPREYRQQLLADTHSIAWALLTHRPDLPGWQLVDDWLTREEAR